MGSGLSAQIGYAEESVYGTGVTVTRFLPLVDESITHDRGRLESEGIIAGQKVTKSSQWNGGPITNGGDIGHELYDRALGLLFKHMFGAVNTTGAGPYTHVFSPGAIDGKSLTIQVGRPQVGGTVVPFTYAGCKIAEWELACTQGEIATLGLTIVAQSETIETALATASYPSGIKPLKFNHGVIELAGSAVKATAVTISGSNGLKDDRRFIGDQQIGEPLEESLREYTGTVTCEWTSTAQYERFVDGDEVALELAFTAGDNSVTIAGNVRYDGGTPTVGGREVLTHDIPVKFIASTTDASAITATLVNGDAAP